MGQWGRLERELDDWAGNGRVATFWWRDDDAVRPTPALERLLALGADHEVPLTLAVIPALAEPALASYLRTHNKVTIVQHGYAHRNHAPAGARACEFDLQRPRDCIYAELVDGLGRLRRLFSEQVEPILVPPWNRIAAALLSELPALGLRGVSTFRARTGAEPVPGLRQANCHVDLIDWRRTQRFVGRDKAITELVAHLGARRRGEAEANEATGLLTHHLCHETQCWEFLEELLEHTRNHPAIRWVSIGEAIWAA